MKIIPMTSILGAEVHDIDISRPLESADISALTDAWLKHKVLFFRDQKLDPESHKRFAGYFGDFQAPGFVPTLPEHPEVRRQEQPTPNGMEANIVWHSDDMFLELPSRGSVLYALDVPEVGGDTVWCDLTAAWDGLSPVMRDMLTGLTALHVPLADTREMLAIMGADAFAKSWKKTTPAEHPVVRTHPVTGRHSLTVNPLNTIAIKGMNRRESDTLLRFLFDHMQQAEYQCRFSWRRGSVAFWDNRSTMHRGMPNFTQGHRLMHRVAIADDARPTFGVQAAAGCAA